MQNEIRQLRWFLINIGFLVYTFLDPGCPAAATVGNLTLQIRMDAIVSKAQVKISITAENSGSEPAHRAQAILHIFGKALMSDMADRLSAGAERTFIFEAPVPRNTGGRFAVVGEIDFRDTMGRALSALSAMTIDVNAAPRVLLEATAPPITIEERGKLTLRMANRHTRRILLDARLFLPKGLAAHRYAKPVSLDPQSDRAVDFALENRFCFAGSQYPVYGILEYRLNGMHHASIVASQITIATPVHWLQRHRWPLLSAGVLIIIFWGGVFIWRINRDRRGREFISP